MTIRQNILEMMAQYLADFNRRDPERIVKYFQIPCIGITPAGIFQYTSVEDVLGLFRDSLAQLESDGFDHSDWVDIHLQVIDTKSLRTHRIKSP